VPRYRKRPVKVDAVEWTGENAQEVAAFVGGQAELLEWGLGKGKWIIFTLEGKMEASPGDYIVRGIKGEYYPVKPDIFKQTYEPVTDGG
jgi:hypothetical protein